jgi:hypothetical protein
MRALLFETWDMLFRTRSMLSDVSLCCLHNSTPATSTEDLEMLIVQGWCSWVSHLLVHLWCFLVVHTTWKGASSLAASIHVTFKMLSGCSLLNGPCTSSNRHIPNVVFQLSFTSCYTCARSQFALDQNVMMKNVLERLPGVVQAPEERSFLLVFGFPYLLKLSLFATKCTLCMS